MSYASSEREEKERGSVIAAAEVEAVCLGPLDEAGEDGEEEDGEEPRL